MRQFSNLCIYLTFYAHVRCKGAIQIIRDALGGRVAKVSPYDTWGRGGGQPMCHVTFLGPFLNNKFLFESFELCTAVQLNIAGNPKALLHCFKGYKLSIFK